MATNFQDLIHETLSDLTAEAKRRLLRALEEEGREFYSAAVVKSAARVYIKSMDAVIETAVKELETEDDAARFIAAYVAEVQEQNEQLMQALVEYVPSQERVARAKKRYGPRSAEADAARSARQLWIEEVRSEVRDSFSAAAGKEVSD